MTSMHLVIVMSTFVEVLWSGQYVIEFIGDFDASSMTWIERFNTVTEHP